MGSDQKMSRRHALGVLAGAIGAGTVGSLAQFSPVAAQSRPAIPRGAIIRTILKDIEPSAIRGHLLFHEHLSFGPAFFERMRPANAPRPATPPPPNYISDPARVMEEVKASAREGIGLIVDGGHPDMATSYDDLKLIAEKTGLHVVASGGYYLQNMYPPEVSTQAEEQLVDGLVRDAEKYRWGAFGEIGSSPTMTDDERKVFRVMARAVQRTNLPMFSHTPHSGCKGCALEQLDILQKSGVDMKKICIGHLSDIADDPQAETHKSIAKSGAFLGFDTVGHRLGPGDSVKVGMILKVLDAGFEDQILLSSDFASDPETKANGGAGYSSVSMVFLPKLRYAGVKEATITKIMTDNPKRFLAFAPRS
jgi:predicted metal-dependent phosphotriesterase family hydrolase